MKKTKLYYEFKDSTMSAEKDYISNYLEESRPNSSSWFKDLHINISKQLVGKYIPSTHKLISYLHKGCLKGSPDHCSALDESFSTAKTCPGLKNILDNSILIKSPCDIVITIEDTGLWIHSAPGEGMIEVREGHPPSQFGAPDNLTTLFQNKKVIKFTIPLSISTEGEPVILLDPQLHPNRSDLTVVSGVLGYPATRGIDLSVITTFEIPEKGETLDINIKKGDILAYIWAAKPLVLEERRRGRYSKWASVPDVFINSRRRKYDSNR